MDAKALGVAAGVGVGTVNAWISRDYVPGVTADAQGRRRDFDINTAVHIAIMAELTHFDFGAPSASRAAGLALRGLREGYSHCLIASPIQEGPIGEAGQKIWYQFFHSKSDLSEVLANVPPDRQPSVYMIIDAGRITTKMQQAEKEWQRHHKRAP